MKFHLLNHLKHIFLSLAFIISSFHQCKIYQAKFVTKKYNDFFKRENDKIHKHVKRLGSTSDLFLTFTDELEKQDNY